MGARAFVPQPGRYPGIGGPQIRSLLRFYHYKLHNTVQGSFWGDGSQEAGSNTAIKSFWRRKFVEIWPFLLDAIYRP